MIALCEAASLLNVGSVARAFAGVGAANAILTLLVTSIAMLLPLPLLAYHFGFTDNARRYFGRSRSADADWLNPRR